MTNSEFLTDAEKALESVEKWCDHINDKNLLDLDNQRVGGMITLTLPNGSQIVINLQKPLHEIWLASQSGGYHFRHDGWQWIDTKGHGEFFVCLAREISHQSGVQINFSPDEWR